MVITLTVGSQCCYCRRYGTGTILSPTHKILTKTGRLRQCRGRMEKVEPFPIEVSV